MKTEKIKTAVFSFPVILLGIFIISEPEICKAYAFSGLLICGNVVIPSLFPFTVCILFLQNSGLFESFKKISLITEKLFKMPASLFAVFVFSLFGGYPIGAKLLNGLVKSGTLSKKDAGYCLNYCINSGAAFIIGAVGSAVFQSKAVGYILFASHTLSSVIMMIVLNRFHGKFECKQYVVNKLSFGDNFVISTADASASILKICGFVILFSAVNGYIFKIGEKYTVFKILSLALEVTNSVTRVKSLYAIAFLLGFGGICIWFQIFSLGDALKINLLTFIASRLAHGFLSTVILKILLIITKTDISVSAQILSQKVIYSTPEITFSLFIMCILFAVSLSSRRFSDFEFLNQIKKSAKK